MIAPKAQFLHKPSGTAAVSSARPERAQGIKTQKYVNMADINRSLAVMPPPAPREETVVDLIELLFFAYRDFSRVQAKIDATYVAGLAYLDSVRPPTPPRTED